MDQAVLLMHLSHPIKVIQLDLQVTQLSYTYKKPFRPMSLDKSVMLLGKAPVSLEKTMVPLAM